MTKVVNINYTDNYDVYCGRPGKGQSGFFGNPHVIGYCQHCDLTHNRSEAIQAYKEYFYQKINNDISFKNEVLKLRNKTLGCFCKLPSLEVACHCDIIADYLDNKNRKCIIAGSRSIDNIKLVEIAVKESGFKIDEIVCGCARGIDTNGETYGKINNIPVVRMPAEWNNFNVSSCVIKFRPDGAKYNSMAGSNRNKKMAQYATNLILIWDGKSSGSASMKKWANYYGLDIYEKIIK